MPEIKGTFQWDDEDLTPGQSKDGGLNHNLYGGKGKGTKGQARFIPDKDQVEPEPQFVYINSDVEPPPLTWGQQLVADVASILIENGLEIAKPIVANWWIVTVVPAIKAKWVEIRTARTRRKVEKPISVNVVRAADDAGVDGPTHEVGTVDGAKATMTREQYEHLVHTLAAAEEVRTMLLGAIEHADVIDGEPNALAQLQEIRELPASARVERIGDYFVANPSILKDFGRSLTDRGPLQLAQPIVGDGNSRVPQPQHAIGDGSGPQGSWRRPTS